MFRRNPVLLALIAVVLVVAASELLVSLAMGTIAQQKQRSSLAELALSKDPAELARFYEKFERADENDIRHFLLAYSDSGNYRLLEQLGPRILFREKEIRTEVEDDWNVAAKDRDQVIAKRTQQLRARYDHLDPGIKQLCQRSEHQFAAKMAEAVVSALPYQDPELTLSAVRTLSADEEEGATELVKRITEANADQVQGLLLALEENSIQPCYHVKVNPTKFTPVQVRVAEYVFAHVPKDTLKGIERMTIARGREEAPKQQVIVAKLQTAERNE